MKGLLTQIISLLLIFLAVPEMCQELRLAWKFDKGMDIYSPLA
ncbi:MAG: hypothetical protein AAF824_22290 [Bacteroidota bacterium]